MGNAVIFSGSAVKALKKEIKLGSGASVISGTIDPTSSAVSAIAGSLYQNETTGKIYRKLDAGSSTNWVEIKESTAKNYILNPDATLDTTGWSVYKDVAGALPVDGTGTISAPNITWTRTTSSPLSGAASFLLTKPITTNCQGEGVSYDFTIDLGDDNGGVFVASCSYMPTSGTFSGGSETTDSDVTVYIVSKEFGTVIQPSYYKLQASVNGKAAKSTAYFQLPVSAGGGSARQFRLCYHVATVSTAAYTVKFDEVSVGPKTDNSFLYGTGKLPTIQKFTTAGGPFTYNRPDGVAYIKVKIVGGGGGGASSGAGLGLPGGTGGSSSFGANLTAGGGTGGSTMTPGTFSVGGVGGSCTVTETATIKQILACTGGNGESGEYYEDQSHGGEGGASALGGAGTGGFGTIAGTPGKDNTGGGGGGGGMNAVDSSGAGGGAGAYLEAVINSPASTYQVYVGAGGSAGPSGGSGSFAGLGGGSGVVIVEEYYTPTDATLSTRNLCSYTHGGGQTINTSWATILFGTKTVDDNALYNTGTGVLTFSEAGDYTVFASMISSGVTLSTSQSVQLRVRKNGSDVLCQSVTYGNGVLNSYGVITGKTFRVNAGDYIEVQGYSDSSTTTSAGAAMFNYFSVVKAAIPVQPNPAIGTTLYPNKLINGGMNFWQRGISVAAGTFTGGDDFQADRWTAFSTTSAGTLTNTYSRVTDSPNSLTKYATKLAASSVSGATLNNWHFAQKTELQFTKDLIGKYGYISFWYKSNRTGNHGIYIYSNGSAGFIYNSSFSVGSADTWEYKTIKLNFTSDSVGSVAENGKHLEIGIGLNNANGFGQTTISNGDYFQFTQVMLCEGPSPLTFTYAGGNLAEEGRLCKRYFHRYSGVQYQAIASGFASAAGTVGNFSVLYPVAMVGAPAFSYSDLLVSYGSSSTAVTSIGASYAGVDSALVQTGQAAVTANVGLGLWLNSTSAYLDISAEL